MTKKADKKAEKAEEKTLIIKGSDAKCFAGGDAGDGQIYVAMAGKTETIVAELVKRMTAKGHEAMDSEPSKHEFGFAMDYVIEKTDRKIFWSNFKISKAEGKIPKKLSTMQQAQKAIADVGKIQNALKKNQKQADVISARKEALETALEAAKSIAKKFGGKVREVMLENAKKSATKAEELAKKAQKRAEEAARMAEEFAFDDDEGEESDEVESDEDSDAVEEEWDD